MVNGCSKNGKGINTHNAMVDTLKEMASYAGLKTKREQTDCFLVGSVKEIYYFDYFLVFLAQIDKSFWMFQIYVRFLYSV